MRLREALMVACAALAAGPLRAQAPAHAPPQAEPAAHEAPAQPGEAAHEDPAQATPVAHEEAAARPRPTPPRRAAPAPAAPGRVRYKATLSLDAVADLNAVRAESGYEQSDALGYVFGDGRLDARLGSSTLRVDAELGGKLFAQVGTEDMLAGQLGATWSRPLASRLALSVDGSYKDKFQRGLDVSDLPDDHACLVSARLRALPESVCSGRRDYRTAKTGVALDGLLGPLALRLRVGAGAFQYKPDPRFTSLGPESGLSVSWRPGRSHLLTAFGGYAFRFYPESPIYRLVGGSVFKQVDGVLGREEQLLSGGLGWRLRGPVPLSFGWTLSASLNNGDGMDVVRNRLEAAAAFRLGRRTSVVASVAVQLAHFPDGQVLRSTALIGDESEQQNALALKVTHRLTRTVSLVAKLQSYSNELSADAVPFQRQVIHGGVQVDL